MLKAINYQEACKISDYLLLNKIGFCFYEGILISKEDCEEIIDNFNLITI